MQQQSSRPEMATVAKVKKVKGCALGSAPAPATRHQHSSQLALHVWLERLVDGIRALVLCHEVRVVRAIKLRKHTLRLVVGQQWLGDIVVTLEPLAHGLGLVVVALDERLAGNVIFALNLGWVVVVGVGAARSRMQPPAASALHYLLGGHCKVQRHVNLHGPAKRLCLGLRARKAIEKYMFLLCALDLFQDHVDNEVVRHQAAGVHVCLGLQPERRAQADLCSQHVTSGHMVEAEVLDQLLANRSLAPTGRTHDERRNASGGE
mmetsp:Transcript_78208/g.207558  ORF Transcript_78208/g.207558 Transcript_78208/m.207558 type:complete len:263 (-) Transcript_78208:99-887(-)